MYPATAPVSLSMTKNAILFVVIVFAHIHRTVYALVCRTGMKAR